MAVAAFLALVATACGADADPDAPAAPSTSAGPSSPAVRAKPELTLRKACPRVAVALDGGDELRTYTDVKEFQVAFDRIRADSDAETSDALDLLNDGIQDLKNALLHDYEGADLRLARASFRSGVAGLSALCESIGATVLT